MDSFGAARKRRPDASLNTNGGAFGSKKSRKSSGHSEMESFSTGLGSKSKPCTKFFSTTGCPFGEGCHFLHYVPGGINAVAQMMNNPALSALVRNPAGPTAHVDGPTAPVVKSKMCTKYNTAEGCKFGDKCRFAHGERELGKSVAPTQEDRQFGQMGGRLAGRLEPPPANLAAAASFGASANAKISVDASLAGAIIGKGGVNSKQICRVTGAKLSIRDHETDPNLRNIELEGSFDQIKQASAMVAELIVNVGTVGGSAPVKNPAPVAPAMAPVMAQANNYKTKLCENFAKGSCTFGERCHFAHGANELRKP